MSMFYPLETRINTLITVRHDRLLPTAGEILVKEGDAVTAEDIVGRYSTRGDWRYLPAAQMLKVPPADLPTYATKQPGEAVQEGEVLATRKGRLFSRLCKAPIAGEVAAIRNGHILLQEIGAPVEMRALVSGRIVNVMPNLGATIETKGASIKAAWSCGPSAWGVIKVLGDAPEDPLQVDQIDIRCHGAILAAGWCKDSTALRQADQMQARGIILGSLRPDMMETVHQLALPILITEGFGELPMNPAAFELLKAHSGNELSLLNPETEDGDPPEIILPTLTETIPPLPVPPSSLQIGDSVRIIGFPRLGYVGHITSLSTVPRRLASGAMQAGADVELSTGETVFVPWMHLEPLG